MRYGIGRGVFTNEAGLGSAPIAHSASNTNSPVKQGMWGMFEVFVTTIIICTISALVILTSDAYAVIYQAKDLAPALNGAALSSQAFNEAIPHVGKYGITITTIFFSLSTILGWAYYGEVCIGYVFNNKKIAITIYRLIFVAFIMVGSVAKINIVWLLADCFNTLMALPNLIALLVLSKTIVSITKNHFDTLKRESENNTKNA
jgi:AGCS family alanine or glycine:cation symporter